MAKFTTIELYKESFKFSAGHFTIFSATERENLHGHNFNVHVIFDCEIKENGLVFDYGIAKKHIEKMCKEHNEYMLLPAYSKLIKIVKETDYIYVYFNGEKIPFLHRDVKILPVENVSVEDLSHYFLEEFKKSFISQFPDISSCAIKIFSGPGQCGVAKWERTKD
ncbi:MAG: 6-carboxytetrahydropterin synthase [Rickettsiales bacterium]|nr:6-carboxytetrahydropterin synthase [Rickettsiales bacterium]